MYVALDLVDLVLPVSGVVRTDIEIPDASFLVGATAHQQVVPVEFDPAGVVTALTATNRLSMTIGSF